jgi:hypothetical protein
MCNFSCKMPPAILSCNSFITFWVFLVDTHYFNMLSCPILHKTSFFIMNGSTFLANCCFCPIDKDSSIYFVYRNILTSFNHSSFVKKKLIFVVCFGICESSVKLGNLDKTSTITWVFMACKLLWNHIPKIIVTT